MRIDLSVTDIMGPSSLFLFFLTIVYVIVVGVGGGGGGVLLLLSWDEAGGFSWL